LSFEVDPKKALFYDKTKQKQFLIFWITPLNVELAEDFDGKQSWEWRRFINLIFGALRVWRIEDEDRYTK